jgi:transposase
LGPRSTDQPCAALFPTRGQPGLAPAQRALVTVRQCGAGLADRHAADAVRRRIDGKDVLGRALTDAGCDCSVMREFRDRRLDGAQALLLLTALLDHGPTAGVRTARGRQRTDSTRVLAAIHALNRLENVGAPLRHALDVRATVAPAWRRGVVPPAWFVRSGRRLAAYRLPKEATLRQALAAQIGADGRHRLTAIHAPTAPAWLREVSAVVTLRHVWVQP